ncbi:MAG: PhzF family phenazine biosynthesis protein [Pseudomonadota bacterium]
MSSRLSFRQVDVFAGSEYRGNPVAVVHDANGLDDEQMARFARWTNLSETTFLLKPESPDADYRLRIFTPGGELPFAGHPTLGSCHAWLEAGGNARGTGEIVQECGAGLVRIKELDGLLSFSAPALVRSGPLEAALVTQLTHALGLSEDAVLDHQWVDNGPGWCALLLDSVDRVLSCSLDVSLVGSTPFGLVAQAKAGPFDFEVRAFVPALGIPEDPVTGSLNAGIAQWLIGSGYAPSSYCARQGTAIGREGIIKINQIDDTLWVSGSTTTNITGTVAFSDF